jgi:hypothetical protein
MSFLLYSKLHSVVSMVTPAKDDVTMEINLIVSLLTLTHR